MIIMIIAITKASTIGWIIKQVCGGKIYVDERLQ